MKYINLIVAFFLGLNTILAQPLTTILPKDGAFLSKPNVDFSWNVLSGTQNYQVWVAQDQNFTLNLIQSPLISENSWTAISLSNNLWFWKVIADDGVQLSESPVYSFRIFEPNDVAGNTLWLAADSNLVMNGSAVASWNDLSGNGHNFQQITPSDQPLLVSSAPAINNKPVLRFDGVSDFMSAGDVINVGTGNLTTFMVAKGTGSYYSKFGAATSPFNIYACYNIGSTQGHEFAGVGYQAFNSTNSTNFHVISFWANRGGNLARLYRNFNVITTGAITGAPSGYNMTTSNPLLVGRYALTGTPYYLNGDVAEVVFYNSNLNDSLRGLVQNYISYKYAPPVNLGKDTLLSSFCPHTLNMPGYTNYLWNTGETTSTISASSAGIYWVQATNIFGVTSRDTIIIYHPTIPGPGVAAICAGQSVTWNADMGPGWTYLWSTGETSPSITFSTVGTYSVTVTDPFGCSKTSDPAIFGIDNYETTAFLGNDTSLCSGNQVALQVGALETLEYYWNGDLTPNQPGGFVVTASGELTLESVNVNGCVAQDTIQVTVSGIAPSADFSYTDLCGSETGTFTDLSVPAGSDPIASWSWDMGDLTNETTQNVSHSYLTPGVYTVQLYVESAGGCGDLHIETLTVFDPPVSSFTVSGHCEDQQVDFASTSTAGDAAITTYSWNFDMPASGAYNFSAIPIPNRIFPDAATYNVSLVVSDANGCQDSLAIPVVIDPSATVDFNYSLACADSTIQLTDASNTLPGSSYNWSWPGGSSILQNTSAVFGISGSYDVTLAVGNTFGCTSTLTKTIVVHPLPLLFLDFGPHCAGTYMNASALTAISNGTVDSVQWLFNGTGLTTGFDVDYLVQQTGQLEVLATAYSDQGCSASVGQNLDVISELDVTFTPLNGTAGAGDIFQFDNTSTGTNVALWNFGDGQFSSVFDATHVYDEQYIDSVMNVYLIGLNNEGCMDTAYGQITVQRPFLDLALEEVFVQSTGQWEIVGVRMRNTGTINVAKAELWVETRAGRLVQETWTGLLAPGQDSIYIFNGQVQSFISEQDDQDDFICVNGVAYSYSQDIEEDLSNNTACKDVEGDRPVLLPVYPNPASGTINISLLISKDESVDLYLTDAIGQRVAEIYKDQQLGAGYYQQAVDVKTLRSGVYFIRLISEGQDISEKILINN